VQTSLVDPRNNPASPSPAVDADGVYVFFPDYGLIAYDLEGQERWTRPLGPFDNIYGMGASPIVVGDLLVLACDQSTGSFLAAYDTQTGEERWRTERPEAKSGHATPILWTSPEGEEQIVLPGSFLMTGYAAATGERRWWVRGLSFEIKSTPAIHGDTVFINGYGAPVNDPGNKVLVPSADEVWAQADADDNGLLSQTEFPHYTQSFWFGVADLDQSGALTREEWAYYRAAVESENGMLAIRLGGSGDMTDSAVRWKYQRAVPQLPSPLVFDGVLYMINDNGIVTTLDPETGERLGQGRFEGALGEYRASPVAADGHVFFVSMAGAVVVLPSGGDLTPIAVNDLMEDSHATPAFADGRIYIRTAEAVYAFGDDGDDRDDR
jgi:outer membrane protein assembly factor BamB